MNDIFEKINKVKVVADQVCGDLQEFFKEKYGFGINDIYFSDDPKTNNTSYFTNEFLRFCFTLADRKIDFDSSYSAKIKQDVLDFINKHGRASFDDLSDNINSAKVFIAKALFELEDEKLIYSKDEKQHKEDRTIMVRINFPYDSSKQINIEGESNG